MVAFPVVVGWRRELRVVLAQVVQVLRDVCVATSRKQRTLGDWLVVRHARASGRCGRGPCNGVNRTPFRLRLMNDVGSNAIPAPDATSARIVCMRGDSSTIGGWISC